MRTLFIKVIVLILFSTCAVEAKTLGSFTWITKGGDPQLFNKISNAFAEELQPDIPEQVKPIVPYLYKYVARIGVFRNSYIVLLGYRERKSEAKEYDHFRAFSYDANSHMKKEILPKSVYYQWALVTQASFESSATPDIIFKYFNCLECEKTELLSSFWYDQKENTWKTRIWPDNDPHLMIGSDMQYGDDYWSYACLYGIKDFNSDGYADIAIRCRVTGDTTRKVTDELLLYTIQDGVANKIQIRDRKNIGEITKVICKGQSSPLCNK